MKKLLWALSNTELLSCADRKSNGIEFEFEHHMTLVVTSYLYKFGRNTRSTNIFFTQMQTSFYHNLYFTFYIFEQTLFSSRGNLQMHIFHYFIEMMLQNQWWTNNSTYFHRIEILFLPLLACIIRLELQSLLFMEKLLMKLFFHQRHFHFFPSHPFVTFTFLKEVFRSFH